MHFNLFVRRIIRGTVSNVVLLCWLLLLAAAAASLSLLLLLLLLLALAVWWCSSKIWRRYGIDDIGTVPTNEQAT